MIIKETMDILTSKLGEVILGKEHQIRLMLACFLARGHVLIEDLPGMGKTTLAQALAQVLGLGFRRIQFTSDLLPADIIGVSIYDRQSGSFKFHHGPIFAHMILADEVNRATPKTQSALLEAMEEHQITVEGETRRLPEPFFVAATQNPMRQIGVFPLPESQLDRFMMCLALGYPDAQAERALLEGEDRRSLIGRLPVLLQAQDIIAMQRQAPTVVASTSLLDYLQAILEYSRSSSLYYNGLSPRAGLAILRAAQAWALMEGRDFTTPDDIQTVLPAVISHRLFASGERHNPLSMATDLIEAVPIP